jgi:hypothetical protein
VTGPEPGVGRPEPGVTRPGVGAPVNERVRVWREAAAELTPARSLARVDEKARQVATQVGLVGTLLTGLGLLGADRLDASPLVRRLVLAAVCAAVAAVVLSVGALLLQFRPALATGDLAEVERWYRGQFRRAYAVVAAGVLVLVALILAGWAAVAALADEPDPAPTGDPVVSIDVTGADLAVRARVTGREPGEALTLAVLGTDPAGSSAPLARAVTQAGADGVADATIGPVPVGDAARVEVRVTAGERRCTAVFPPNDPTPPAVTCTN